MRGGLGQNFRDDIDTVWLLFFRFSFSGESRWKTTHIHIHTFFKLGIFKFPTARLLPGESIRLPDTDWYVFVLKYYYYTRTCGHFRNLLAAAGPPADDARSRSAGATKRTRSAVKSVKTIGCRIMLYWSISTIASHKGCKKKKKNYTVLFIISGRRYRKFPN